MVGCSEVYVVGSVTGSPGAFARFPERRDFGATTQPETTSIKIVLGDCRKVVRSHSFRSAEYFFTTRPRPLQDSSPVATL